MKNHNGKFTSSKTTPLLILGILGAIGSLFWLNESLRSSSSSKSQNYVAEIKQCAQDVRLRHSGDLHWENISGPTKASEKDVIFTGANSRVVIEFKDGPIISMSSDSLISISRHEMLLEKGEIEILSPGSGKFIVKSGKKSLDANNLKIIKVIDEDGRLEVLGTDTEHWAGTEDNFSLTLEDLPKEWDFTASELEVKIQKPADIKQIQFLSEDLQGRESITEDTLTLSKLPDGEHEFVIKGEVDGVYIKSPVYKIRVKNSPKKAPKIETLKARIFVWLKKVSDVLLASAHAQEGPGFLMVWSGKRGEFYRIEVFDSTKSRIIFSTKIKSDRFNFPIPFPGVFFWRVREESDEKDPGPFSEFAELKVIDKITNLKTDLNASTSANASGAAFDLPKLLDEFSYFVELFRGDETVPYMRQEAKTEQIMIPGDFITSPIHWELKGRSKWGTEVTVVKRRLIEASPKNEQPQKKLNLHFSTHFAQTDAKFKLDRSDSNEDDISEDEQLRGPVFLGSLMFFPAFFSPSFSSELNLEYRRLTRSTDFIHELKADTLVTLNRFFFGAEHYFSIGPGISLFESEFKKTKSGFLRLNGVIKYKVEKILLEKIVFSSDLIFCESLSTSASGRIFEIRPGMEYRFANDFTIGLMFSKMMANVVPVTENTQAVKEISIKEQLYSIGIQMNWRNE